MNKEQIDKVDVQDLYELRRQLEKIQTNVSVMISKKKGNYVERFKDMTEEDKGDYIISKVCEYYKITIGQLKKKGREPRTVWKKQVTIKIMADYTALTDGSIAHLLGYSNHTIVVYHRKEINDILSDEFYNDKNKKIEYENLLNFIGIK